MNTLLPRTLIVALAALFSAYHLVLAGVSIEMPQEKMPYIAAMVVYAVATTLSLWPSDLLRMPVWLAVSNVGAAVSMIILVTGQLPDGPGSETYAGWYTGAIATLMVITSVRRRHLLAWLGTAALVASTVATAGPAGVLFFGVAGAVTWVGVAHALSSSLAAAGRDAHRYTIAEKEAVDWRAAQDAHVFERQFRLGQTARMALPMLRRISATAGELTDAEREECLTLEGAIRDEIRGRRLLNDHVRREVMAARRRGTVVTLLDEGGIDSLADADLDRVLNRLADAIAGSTADRIVARTVPDERSATAVTVLALRSADDGVGSVLGCPVDDEDDDDGVGAGTEDTDEVELWLEIPRVVAALSLPA